MAEQQEHAPLEPPLLLRMACDGAPLEATSDSFLSEQDSADVL